MKNKDNSLLDVLKTIFKWKRAILIVCGIALVGSVAISLLLPNYYQSSCLFYAANESLARPQGLGNTLVERFFYGSAEDVDRILSIAKSSEVANYLIDRFDLYNHYKINRERKDAAYKVRFKLNSAYQAVRTKLGGIELSVEDTDPEIAAAMANAARGQTEAIARRMLTNTIKSDIDGYVNSIEEKQETLVGWADSLENIRNRYNIVNPAAQSEVISELLETAEASLNESKAKLEYIKKAPGVRRDSIQKVEASIQSNTEKIVQLVSRRESFNEGFGKIQMIERLYENGRSQISVDKEYLKQLEAHYKSSFPVIHLVEEAPVPLRKSRPKRSILVISALLIAFILSVIGVLVFDNYKDVNWREIVYAK